jgi:hypothetical protein
MDGFGVILFTMQDWNQVARQVMTYLKMRTSQQQME